MCIICIDETKSVDTTLVDNALQVSRSISKNSSLKGESLILFSFFSIFVF